MKLIVFPFSSEALGDLLSADRGLFRVRVAHASDGSSSTGHNLIKPRAARLGIRSTGMCAGLGNRHHGYTGWLGDATGNLDYWERGGNFKSSKNHWKGAL